MFTPSGEKSDFIVVCPIEKGKEKKYEEYGVSASKLQFSM